MANRLAEETSPYLLQHKDNPVEWYAWGPDALERAKARSGLSSVSKLPTTTDSDPPAGIVVGGPNVRFGTN